MQNPLKYNKSYDSLTDKENRLFEINKKSIADFVEQSPSINDVNHATRNAHAKTYALVNGYFLVDKNIPTELNHFFDMEKYDVTIRFSNANLKINQNKKDIPAYGFAVKVKNEEGKSIANYPLANFPVFPINSVSAFLNLFTSVNRFFINKWSLFSFLFHFLKITPSMFTGSFLKNSLKLWAKRKNFFLSFNYYSVGAYRLGDNMIKIKLTTKNIDENYGKDTDVKNSIENYLKVNNFTAEVFIQVCYNIQEQPINKLNVEWKNSTYIKVGELKIEKDNLLNPNSYENELLSFNPFENLPFFQPVGKIQRLRNEAYKVSLQTRLKINKLLKYK